MEVEISKVMLCKLRRPTKRGIPTRKCNQKKIKQRSCYKHFQIRKIFALCLLTYLQTCKYIRASLNMEEVYFG